MTAKNVTNATEGTLTLPNGPSILPRRTVRVENWPAVESNSMVQGWLDAGAITIANAPKRDEEEASGTDSEPKGKGSK